MNHLKKFIVFFILSSSLNIQSQDKVLMNSFSESYDFEAVQKYDAAISVLNLVYVESSYEINIRLGWLNYLAGKHKESIALYLKAIALMPAATEPLWAVINPLTKLDSWKEIEKMYLSILKIDPKNAAANYNLGLIYYYRKDFLTAKKHFDISLNLSPFGFNNLLMSAWTNYFLGYKNQAIALFNKSLLYSPNNKSALEGLSLIK